jgi:hypothetical protein
LFMMLIEFLERELLRRATRSAGEDLKEKSSRGRGHLGLGGCTLPRYACTLLTNSHATIVLTYLPSSAGFCGKVQRHGALALA